MVINSLVEPGDIGAKLEPAVNGMLLSFPYHSPRFLKANCNFLLKLIERGEKKLLKGDYFSLAINDKTVVVRLFEPESGHSVAKFDKNDFISFLKAHHHNP